MSALEFSAAPWIDIGAKAPGFRPFSNLWSMNAPIDTPPIRILHIEDSEVDHKLVKFALRRNGLSFDLVRVERLEDFERELREHHYDAVLADYHLPGFTAMDAWEVFCKSERQPPFIILSGAIGETAAVDAIRRGMADYVLKDSMHRLEHVVLRAIEMHEIRQARTRADADLAESERRLADLTEHLQSSIEAERAAIAREVHDDIGGALAAVKLDLAWILHRQTLDERGHSHLNSALEMVQHALGASQRIMKNLRPAILDQGLVPAIEWLLASFERRTGVQTRFTGGVGDAQIPPEVQQVAYRTAQEALTNISKHAQANQVKVDLATGGGVLTLEVADDGKGLGEGALKKADSFGLRGLRERARTVNGWLDVTSGPGGTSVILSVPLSKAPTTTQEDSGDTGSTV